MNLPSSSIVLFLLLFSHVCFFSSLSFEYPPLSLTLLSSFRDSNNDRSAWVRARRPDPSEDPNWRPPLALLCDTSPLHSLRSLSSLSLSCTTSTNMESRYDPPIVRTRGRSSSFSTTTNRSARSSASSSFEPLGPRRTRRRQSLGSLQSPPPDYTSRPRRDDSGSSDDDENDKKRLIDLSSDDDDDGRDAYAAGGQTRADFEADLAVEREGRQSKAQRLERDGPHDATRMTSDMEHFMAQVYDLTHTIDKLDNDIDEIVAMRNLIVQLDPRVDVGQVSLESDLSALAALTTDSGKRIVSLEQWLLQLNKWSKRVGQLVKSRKAGETLAEVGEIKFEIANAKLVRHLSLPVVPFY